jgi:hypothetical protein
VLIVSTRPYDEIVGDLPVSTPPRLSYTPSGRTITFQPWQTPDGTGFFQPVLTAHRS